MERRLLLHVCCAPCMAGTLEMLREEGFYVTGLFYNPNIHPLIEFRRRLKGVKMLVEIEKIEMDMDENYGLEEFLREVYIPGGSGEGRCGRCYDLRMARAAKKTRELGFEAFTTTLLASRHQDHDRIAMAGEAAAAREGVSFLMRDFKAGAERGREIAQKRSLYLQNYCGCIFSENERYRDTTKHLYRGQGEVK